MQINLPISMFFVLFKTTSLQFDCVDSDMRLRNSWVKSRDLEFFLWPLNINQFVGWFIWKRGEISKNWMKQEKISTNGMEYERMRETGKRQAHKKQYNHDRFITAKGGDLTLSW